MNTYEIKVDEEVWSFLKKHAEPFVDTPNSVLRKFLFGNNNGKKNSNIEDIEEKFPAFPGGVPKALAQILEVIYLVKKRGYTRTDATKLVAEKRKTAPQTVIDKYCRQLNKKAFEIDQLLQGSHLIEFQSLLEKKFVHHRDVIKDFFNSLL